jgi:thioester reductase-like protein
VKNAELLLTGATGYIGQALLWKWLRATDARCSLLVRSRHGTSPVIRVQDALREFGDDPLPWMDRIQVFDADVSVERLGLNEADYEELAGRVTHIVHGAAAARFDLDIAEARRTNVGGVKHILDFAARCRGLEKVDYIGTAYVCGLRTGLIREAELDTGQQHRNTYERSKFEAEMLVRDSMRQLPIAILRPSIVICDSRTGYASNHNGFYRALRMYLKGGLTMLPGYPESLLDLVPVDYVAEACFSISHSTVSIGQCYHLTAGPDNTTRLGEIQELASRYSGKEKFTLLPPQAFLTLVGQMASRLGEEELKALKEMELYMPYLLCEHQFDNTNTLCDTGLTPPPVRDYFGKFVERILHSN